MAKDRASELVEVPVRADMILEGETLVGDGGRRYRIDRASDAGRGWRLLVLGDTTWTVKGSKTLSVLRSEAWVEERVLRVPPGTLSQLEHEDEKAHAMGGLCVWQTEHGGLAHET